MDNRRSATYKAVADSGGYRFLFYCDVSEAHVCTTKRTYTGNTLEAALLNAWQEEGRMHFNRCQKCGKWVIDAAYNVEVLECVECAPYEAEPHFCKYCGAKIEGSGKRCPSCSSKLIYDGKEMAL